MICPGVCLVRFIVKSPAQSGRMRTLIHPGPILGDHVTYNEGEELKVQASVYGRCHGHYPKVIFADQIYRNRANWAICLRHGSRLSGPRLGRPKSDPELLAEEKRQFLDGQRQRNAVEGKIGQGKRRFGLGLIREKLAITQGSTIALNVLVMNLEKLLELLFVFFTVLLRLLLSTEGGRSIRTVPPKPQMAAA